MQRTSKLQEFHKHFLSSVFKKKHASGCKEYALDVKQNSVFAKGPPKNICILMSPGSDTLQKLNHKHTLCTIENNATNTNCIILHLFCYQEKKKENNAN